jgi:hypothetical protein
MRSTAANGPIRRSAGYPVCDDMGEALVPAKCGPCVGAEVTIEGPGGKTAPGKLELERGDVPAALAALQHSISEAVASVAAQYSSGLRAGDPVDDDPGPALERADGSPRPRAHDSVDGASVEPTRLESDLEGGDVGGSAGTRVGDKCEQPDEREQRNACSERHEPLSFAPERNYPRPL